MDFRSAEYVQTNKIDDEILGHVEPPTNWENTGGKWRLGTQG
jgi:hypothetical protein